MRYKGELERELVRCMDSLIEYIGSAYGTDITEEARIDSKMGDIQLRDALIRQFFEEVRCKKICERIWAERNKESSYAMEVRISGSGVSYGISRN
ncbi:MAG: hypothetical protein ACREBH_00620 [Candidatus Micrarchaeaceae archaeon]